MNAFKSALATVTPARLVEIARAAVERFDAAGWSNEVTGFGTARDKSTYTVYAGVQYLSDVELSNLYHGDDLAQRMIDIVPDEMLREGFTVDVRDATANTEIADQLEALGARSKFANGIRWGRLFGAGALLIGADDGRPASKPLDAERAKGVRYLYELDKRLMWPLTWYNEPGHPLFGKVETYLVTSAAPHVASANDYSIVHESRLLVFGGASTGLWERAQNNGFDRSVLQRAFEALRAFNTGWKAVEILLADGNQAVYKLQGVADMIGANGESLVKARMQVVDMFRSVMRAMVIDAGDAASGTGAESFERQSVSLTDYPATLDRFMLRLAAAVQIPATILYGQSPAGMNATGESDFRWFYDRIRSKQTLDLAPLVRRLVRVLLQTKSVGQRDADIVVTFPSLWKEPPSAEATRRKTIAETDAIRIQSGELLPEEIALTRSQPNGFDLDVMLTPEAIAARQTSLRAATEGEDSAASTVTLAPTDIARVITVNEGRKSQGLGPLMLETGAEDPEGALTVSEFSAKRESAAGGGGGFGGGGPPAFGDGGNFDMTDDVHDLTPELEGHSRVIIAGGPRTGKSTLAVRAGERFGRRVRHADSLVGKLDWSDASQAVSEWFDDGDGWIVEGVSTPRAIRKWLAANPGKAFPVAVVYLAKAIQIQSKGQATMTKTVGDVWAEVEPELRARGATVIKRDSP